MKKNIRTIILMVLALCVMCGSAFAAEVGVVLNAEIILHGTLPETAEEFRVVLTADKDTYPMPGGVMGGTTSIAITGEGTGAFDEIVYDRVGIYTYTIDMVNGQIADATYDQTVYNVVVTVVNAPEGGLEAVAVMYKQGGDAKQENAEFENIYVTITPEPATPEPGEVTDTGVEDKWPWYLAGAAVMLILAAVAIKVLREKNVEEAQPETSGITDADLAELADDLDADFFEDEENDKK